MDDKAKIDIKQAAKEILETIEREREREIIARRFGLYDRKETLEQIGKLLWMTRERVRQLEKAILIRLKQSAEKDLPHIDEVEKEICLRTYLNSVVQPESVILLQKSAKPEMIEIKHT